MQKAIAKAGWKLGGGGLLVGAVLGVRIVTADPDGIESEIEELATLEAELAADAEGRGVEAPFRDAEGRDADTASSDAEAEGLVARMSATVRDTLSGGETGPDPNRLVRCDLGGGVQFMRAADCQSRGGGLTDVDR